MAIGLGDVDAALQWLDTALEERASWLCTLLVDPRWEPIREDARFQSRLRQVNFPPVR